MTLLEVVMAQGKVTVNNLNMFQGAFPEIERTFLFMGHAPEQQGKVVPVNTQTDFDVEFGEADSILKTNLKAALINAGQNWQAYVMPMAEDADHSEYLEAIEEAMKVCSPECIVILHPVISDSEIKHYRDEVHRIRAVWGRVIFMMLATQRIDYKNESWADYYKAKEDMVDEV
jgi:hypothetical protein